VGEVQVDATGERRGRGGKISPDQARALCGIADVRADRPGFVLVDSEGWLWIGAVGTPRDGGPRDGELHQSAREGATFAATQSRQNSLPSMSCITRHDSLSSSASRSRTRTAPSATSRAHSASSAATR
jgi:hypothetical protein